MRRRLMWTGKEIYSKMVFLVLLAFLLCMYLPFFAEAQTYYVCDNGTDCNAGAGSGWSTGSDSNTTEQAQNKATPWKTIEYGANQLTEGDILIVGDGTYTNHDTDQFVVGITANLVGTAWGEGTTQITIKAENKYGAKIGGNEPEDYTMGIAGINTVKYLWIEGFEIYGIHRGIHFNALTAGIHENIYIKNCKIHDIGNFTQISDESSIIGIRTPPGGKNITIDSCYFYNIGRLPGGRGVPHDYVHDHAIYATGRGILIENCIFRNITAGWGVKIDHNRGTVPTGSEWTHRIINNTFHDSNNPIISGHINFFRNTENTSYNVVIANNVFHQPPSNNPYGVSSAIWAGVYDATTCSKFHCDTTTLTLINNTTTATNLLYPCTAATDVNNVTSVIGDMGMTDPINHDFSLTSNAVFLLDKGSSDYAPKKDYEGNTRPYGGGFDIGAFEGDNSTTREPVPSPPKGVKIIIYSVSE